MMRVLFHRFALLALLALPAIASAQAPAAPFGPTSGRPTLLAPMAVGPTSSEAGVVNEAASVLYELAAGTATQIPENLLASAEGVAIVPHFIQGAFVIGIAGGRGVFLTRDANRQWQAPEFITIGGGSIGWQAGVQSIDLVLVFRSPRSVTSIRQGRLTLGVNATAAAGPIGRFASAGTDSTAQAEIFTYSRSRGLFAGISLSGASLQIDVPATQRFYQTLGGGPGVVPPSAISLVDALNRFSGTVPPVSPSSFIDSGNPLQSTTPAPVAAASSPSGRGDFVPPMIAVSPETLAALERSVSTLLAKVDAQWQAFLALPATWRGATQLPSGEVHATLVRYERVATNPDFAALRSVAEFEQALSLLRQLASETAKTYQLRLPPPPALDDVGVSRGRY